MYGDEIFRFNKHLMPLVCCVSDEIFSILWFSKELKWLIKELTLWCHLILLVHELIFVGWGFPFPIVLMPWYKLSLSHTPIKPDLLGFPGICYLCMTTWSGGSHRPSNELLNFESSLCQSLPQENVDPEVCMNISTLPEFFGHVWRLYGSWS